MFLATSQIDRYIIAIALPAIGLELGLNDLQLGILSGIAFSLVFALGAIPLSMVTAFVDRRHVVALSMFLWSLMTLLSGFAGGFVALMLARIGIGLAEAGGVPAAHVAITETYEDEERATAFSILNAGANIGLAIALVGGGILVQVYGWRVAMIVAGLPGMVLAPFAYRAMAPQPAGAPVPRDAPRRGAVLREAISTVLTTPSKRLTWMGGMFTSVITFGMLAWLPSFLIRAHDLPAPKVGLFMALAIGIGGALGTVLGGRLVTRMARRDKAWMLWLPMGLLLVAKPFLVSALLVQSSTLALALLVPPMTVAGLHLAMAFVVVHDGLEPRTKTMVSAFLLLSVNLVGYTLGPLIVGGASWAMADLVPGEERLGYAMVLLQALSVIGLFAYWRAGYAYRSFDAPSPSSSSTRLQAASIS